VRTARHVFNSINSLVLAGYRAFKSQVFHVSSVAHGEARLRGHFSLVTPQVASSRPNTHLVSRVFLSARRFSIHASSILLTYCHCPRSPPSAFEPMQLFGDALASSAGGRGTTNLTAFVSDWHLPRQQDKAILCSISYGLPIGLLQGCSPSLSHDAPTGRIREVYA